MAGNNRVRSVFPFSMRAQVTVSLLLGVALCLAIPCASAGATWRFCYGLQDPSDLPLILQFGLNTLYLELTPEDALDVPGELALVREAKAAGLQVVVGLPTLLPTSFRVSPYDARYCAAARETISSLVDKLKDEPGVTAWATESALERRLSYSDGDFQVYLQRGYPSLDALNAKWGSQHRVWSLVTMEAARQQDEKAPNRVGPASVDLANYQADAFRRVMTLWLDAIRAQDARRPVLTGRVTLYRSLVSIPEGYDTVCVSMPPDVLEPDLVAHNPQSLDLARRGGKFHVLPVLRVPSNASAVYSSGGMAQWAEHAALHGASGYALENWELLSRMYAIERRISEPRQFLLTALRHASQVGFGLTPEPTVAVLYSPYASGFDVTRQPVYGYLLDYLAGEPSGLIGALRLGTRYGVVDYLTVTDLRTTELDRYGCVLAPACLDLSMPQANQLAEYVHNGGALLADLGLGSYQTGSWGQLPQVLQNAFGIVAFGEIKERLGDLTTAQGLRVLSPWPRGAQAHGTFSPASGETAPANQRRGYSVSGWVGEAQLQDSAGPVATLSVRFDKDKRPIFSGLVGQEFGSGVALFATHPLWQYWPLGDGLSLMLHGKLMARRATHELVQPGLLQAEPYFSAGNGEAQVFNPERKTSLAQVWAYEAASHAYARAAANFTAAPGLEGLKPGTALLTVVAPAGGSVRAKRSGLLVQPRVDDVTVVVLTDTPEQLSFDIAGAGAMVQLDRGRIRLQGGQAVGVRLIISSGTYPVAPLSRHQAVVSTRGRKTQTVLTASPEGELDLSDVYRSSTVTLVPL
jgi:hypothetical protein